MLHTKKEVYLTYRRAFVPERAKLVIVAEDRLRSRDCTSTTQTAKSLSRYLRR